MDALSGWQFLQCTQKQNYFSITVYEQKFKGGLGWDVLIIFKCFRVDFSLNMKTISAFVQSLFSTKKSPKVGNFPLIDETLSLSFWRHKQDKWLFHFSKLHEVVKYLFNSLAEVVRFFENTLKPLTVVIFLS